LRDKNFAEAIESFKSKDLKSRMAAIDAVVREVAPKEAISLLLQALQDESWHLRNHAANALIKMGSKTVSPLLHLLSEGVWYVRASVASVLGELGEERSIKPLLGLLRDSNQSVRKQALSSLLKLSTQGLFAKIAIELRKEDPEIREMVVKEWKKLNLEKALELEENFSSSESSSFLNENKGEVPTPEEMKKFRQMMNRIVKKKKFAKKVSSSPDKGLRFYSIKMIRKSGE